MTTAATIFPAITLSCSLFKTQLPFPQLKTYTLNTIFTCSSFKPNNSNSLQNSKPRATHYSNENTLLFDEWPELLKISIGSRDFLLGQAIHAYFVKSDSKDDAFEGNNILNFYVKFNRLDLARKVFDRMFVRNTITWTSLIKGYLEDGDLQSAYNIVGDMHKFGEKFNEHTCTVILEACSSQDDWILGEQIHCFVIKSGLDENVPVGTSLIAMYAENGFFDDAEKVFDSIVFKDVRCLNFMILQYGRTGNGEKAIEVLLNIPTAGFKPTDYTFTNVISACNGDLGVEEGKQLQGLACKYGLLNETSVGNAIITMYGNNGMAEEAERMFSSMSERNLISWTALISGYTRNGHGKKAVDIFLRSSDYLGLNLDSSLLTAILDGCSGCRNLELGLQIHGIVIKLGYACDMNTATALIDLYAKCENLKSARLVFNVLTSKSIASFNAILAGSIESNGVEEDSMVLFNQLRLAGIKPDSVTFSRFFSISANQASLERGKSVHAYAIKTGFDANTSVANAMISMYAKCGSIEDAHQIFNVMNGHDSISWNAMISAYAFHGQGKRALSLFEEMKKKGFDPDELTILAILQACTYSAIWKDGISLFNSMEQKYGIKPLLEHYACMVDLLGRAGHFSEAMQVINRSPFPNSTLLWRTLINVCKLHGNLKLGKLASEHLLHLSPMEAGSYILVSNLYASGKMLEDSAKARTVMNDLKLSKEAGRSWIEVDKKVHYFVASDKDHPESREIYRRLDLLTNEMKWGCNKAGLDLIWELRGAC